MFKVLLVDDEILDLEGLERLIPWGKLDMTVVGAFDDAFEALSFMEQNEVDIVVSDIKMPILTGLELARRTLELQPKVKIIFVSGYEDFHYAKQALQMNAHGYVLKPVDDNELVQVLSSTRDSLLKELQNEQLEDTWRSSLTLAQDRMLLQWLEGRSGIDIVRSLVSQAGIPLDAGAYYVSIVELDDAWKFTHDLQTREKQEALDKAMSAIAACLDSARNYLLCRVDPSHLAIVSTSPGIKEEMEALVSFAPTKSGISITVAVGEPCLALEEMHHAYEHATEMLYFKMFCGKGKVITSSSIDKLRLQDALNIEELLSGLFAAIANYELVKIDDCLLQWYGYVNKLGKRMTVYNATLHIITRLDSYLMSINESLKGMLDMDLEKLELLYQFETVGDIHAWLRRRLFEISEMLHRKKQKKNRKLIQEIEAYVLERLGDNVTLRDVAQHFSFSSNYLGHLFKEETDENFSDFVIQKRMERAQELLKDPKLKIYEVAYQVGYKNLTYFSRQFKERYGVTPGDYRRQS